MVKEAQKTKKMHPLLPVMGLVIAVCLGVLAYFLSPIVIDLIEKQVGEYEFNQRVGNSRQYLEYAFAAFIWLVLFALAMAIVSAAIGEDPEEELRLVRPREGDVRAWRKYERAQRKMEERRMKQAKAKLRAEERAKSKIKKG